MEDLNKKLHELLLEELDSLAIGHTYNTERIAIMHKICHLLMYNQYVDIQDNDLVKILKIY